MSARCVYLQAFMRGCMYVSECACVGETEPLNGFGWPYHNGVVGTGIPPSIFSQKKKQNSLKFKIKKKSYTFKTYTYICMW